LDSDVSPLKKRRQGVKSCSSLGESVAASSVEDNSLVRFICLLSEFVYNLRVDVLFLLLPSGETFASCQHCATHLTGCRCA